MSDGCKVWFVERGGSNPDVPKEKKKVLIIEPMVGNMRTMVGNMRTLVGNNYKNDGWQYENDGWQYENDGAI